jgi:hypothetical protein
MGLFDRVRCSYKINEHFNSNILQTKGLKCALSEYWISPAGELFEIDDCITADFIEVDDDTLPPWARFQWIPNGNHGKVIPTYITDCIEVYPEQNPNAKWEQWPRCSICFKSGKITHIEILR